MAFFSGDFNLVFDRAAKKRHKMESGVVGHAAGVESVELNGEHYFST